jgi:hypothetical protein
VAAGVSGAAGSFFEQAPRAISVRMAAIAVVRVRVLMSDAILRK